MLKIKNLCLEINTKTLKKYILENLNLEIKQGEKVCVIGPSGAGKSTFLRCLNLLESPTSGDIVFENESILDKNKNINLLRTKIGMIFQNFNLFTHLNVIKNITIALTKVKKVTKEKAEEIAFKYLKKLGLETKANEFPVRLSGGEKQRIAIIRALVMNPKIILVDEPTSALDPKTSEEISNLFKNFIDKNITIICITHDMDFLKNFADRIIYINKGKIEYDGPIDAKKLKAFEFD